MYNDAVDLKDMGYVHLPEQDHFARMLADDLVNANPDQIRAWCASVARYITPHYINDYIFVHEECGERLPVLEGKRNLG